jgi:hypothetical protein
MKYLIGIERKDFLAGIIEKEIEASEFAIDDKNRVLYFYNGVLPVAAFLSWEYVRVANEEA